MEAYGNNSAVEVLGKFHVFLRWKGKVYRQLFYVTNVNNTPNLLSRDGCYTLGVIKPCYVVEADSSSSQFQGIPQAVPTQPSIDLEKANVHGECKSHCENEGTVMENWSCSSKCSIMRCELQGDPLTKAKILDVYSDMFSLELGSSPVSHTSSSSRKMQNLPDMHQERFQFICRMLPQGNQKFGTTWNP